ncbi:neurochondrin-like [Papaver somniferum]|uniref:neurochondrin-like n=1 Tax=Papaver somniferum TaxID=3469 RepID=UPI000E703631|nr:neurochondrin-like [Papaver somniferum]XP_026402247.1 neurochondrin-like [Papaver somniferum]XP_026402249.1 neurochondrin-like [Papaver somniferum]
MNSKEQAPALEDCLKLLKGERDEQRLAGLLLATKFCTGDDHTSIRRIYDAVGDRFLDRLLMSGTGKATAGVKEVDNQDAYLQLSVTILAAICRVAEIASSIYMISKVPVILEILSKGVGPTIYDECYEFLFLVSTASEGGLTKLYDSGCINVLASSMYSLPNGSHSFELALRVLQLVLTKLPLETICTKYPSELTCMVAVIAKQFALLHNALKFEVLHLLTVILSSNYAVPVHNSLRLMLNNSWTTYMRVGIVAVLQNRVVSAEKLQALILAESIISIVGENWLIDQKQLPNDREIEPIPADRCLLLVLESSRVEVAVLLNEIAYMKYEENQSIRGEVISLKHRNLAVAFSLIEKTIKLISGVCGNEEANAGSPISERTLAKVFAGLTETIGVVLEFLQDAKDHGQRKGDDLLASVRVIGSYLAETPFACKEKIDDLLEYMLSVEGEDEPSPFFSTCFLLPMLCQVTVKIEGCKMLASFGGHNSVMECLVKLIGLNSMGMDSSTIFMACDTMMNLLLRREDIRVQFDGSIQIHLLTALASWAENINDQSIIMMASTLCSLIFDSTSEEALVNHPNVGHIILNKLSQLIMRSLATYGQDMFDNGKADVDLHQIISRGYAGWADRFPEIKKTLQLMKQ